MNIEKVTIKTESSEHDSALSQSQYFTDDLAGYSKDHVLFSHSALLIYGGLSIDPVMDFVVKNNHDKPQLIISKFKLFNNLARDEASAPLEYILFSVPKEIWKGLSFHLGTISGMDKKTQTYFEVVLQELPFHTKTNTSIFATALDGNKVQRQFLPSKHCISGYTIYDFVTKSPDEKLISQAKAVLGTT